MTDQLRAARIRLFEEDRLRSLVVLARDGRRGMTRVTRFDVLDMAVVIEDQVSTIEALQARVLMAETANIGYRLEREEDHETIASLREALEEIRDGAVMYDGGSHKDRAR